LGAFTPPEDTSVRFLSIALLALGIAACNDSHNNVVIPLQSVPGTYDLKTINGSPLPFTFSDGTTLNSDLLVLKDDGTFTETMKTANGQTFVDTGTYTVSNNFITINDETAGITYSASLTGTVLTAVFPNGLTEVFNKK
jgi:hypothetical protein